MTTVALSPVRKADPRPAASLTRPPRPSAAPDDLGCFALIGGPAGAGSDDLDWLGLVTVRPRHEPADRIG